MTQVAPSWHPSPRAHAAQPRALGPRCGHAALFAVLTLVAIAVFINLAGNSGLGQSTQPGSYAQP